MSKSGGMLLLIADIMPIEMIIKHIKEMATEYEVNPSNDNKKQLEAACFMFLQKTTIIREEGGVEKVIEKLDKAERAINLLSPKEN